MDMRRKLHEASLVPIVYWMRTHREKMAKKRAREAARLEAEAKKNKGKKGKRKTAAPELTKAQTTVGGAALRESRRATVPVGQGPPVAAVAALAMHAQKSEVPLANDPMNATATNLSSNLITSTRGEREVKEEDSDNEGDILRAQTMKPEVAKQLLDDEMLNPIAKESIFENPAAEDAEDD